MLIPMALIVKARTVVQHLQVLRDLGSVITTCRQVHSLDHKQHHHSSLARQPHSFQLLESPTPFPGLKASQPFLKLSLILRTSRWLRKPVEDEPIRWRLLLVLICRRRKMFGLAGPLKLQTLTGLLIQRSISMLTSTDQTSVHYQRTFIFQPCKTYFLPRSTSTCLLKDNGVIFQTLRLCLRT